MRELSAQDGEKGSDEFIQMDCTSLTPFSQWRIGVAH